MSCPVYFTQEFLQQIEEAIAKGVKKVEYDDKKIEYRSLDELLKIRDLIKKELCPGSKILKNTNPSYDKGLC